MIFVHEKDLITVLNAVLNCTEFLKFVRPCLKLLCKSYKGLKKRIKERRKKKRKEIGPNQPIWPNPRGPPEHTRTVYFPFSISFPFHH
jgi:hypothetical protein